MRWFGRLALILAGGIALAATFWWWTLPAPPDAFYAPPPGGLPAAGRLIRHEAFTRGVPEGADAWRLLYATTDPAGRPVAGSALVLAPGRRGAEPLPVLVWTHGTTGVARACAPSALAKPFAHVPALPEALARGWAVVAPDYAGLGTEAVHGYLIGESEARSTWDAVRAARALPDLALAPEMVLWGHSQGGHATLWSAARIERYPEAGRLQGAVAMAPASDLVGLVREAQDTPVGRMISAYLVTAYAAHYPELDAEALLRPLARPVVADMAKRCMAGLEALPGVVDALLLRRSVFRDDPTQGALGARLAENRAPVPGGLPVLLVQGLADPLVAPAVQDAFVAAACREGARITYRRYEGEDHLSIVAPDSPAASMLLEWTAARFAGLPPDEGCGGPPAGPGAATTPAWR
jgi:fermentation-respiration switch protein FrsA (DUF1100 family)